MIEGRPPSVAARPVQQVAADNFRAAYAAEAAARASRNASRKRTIDRIMECKTVAEIMEVIASHPPPKKADGLSRGRSKR